MSCDCDCGDMASHLDLEALEAATEDAWDKARPPVIARYQLKRQVI